MAAEDYYRFRYDAIVDNCISLYKYKVYDKIIEMKGNYKQLIKWFNGHDDIAYAKCRNLNGEDVNGKQYFINEISTIIKRNLSDKFFGDSFLANNECKSKLETLVEDINDMIISYITIHKTQFDEEKMIDNIMLFFDNYYFWRFIDFMSLHEKYYIDLIYPSSKDPMSMPVNDRK